MTRATVAFSMCIAVAGILTAALHASGEQPVRPAARFNLPDKQLRDWAITSPTPVYPTASLAKRVTGVVVATLLFDPKGVLESVEILQSPDAATGRAVHDALMRWTFKPVAGDGGQGIVVFYFHMKGQKGVVLSPAEMREVTNPGAKENPRDDEPPLESITEPEFRGLPTRPGPIVLDIRDRETFAEGHERRAVNIPVREVLTRAAAELPTSRHIVVDCRDPIDLCAMVVHWLRSSGFGGQVSVLTR